MNSPPAHIHRLMIDGVSAPVRKCQACGFLGFVRSKTMIRPGIEIDPMKGTSDSAPTLDVCIECFETPTGILSANAAHQRLPEKEYLEK